MSVTNLHDMTLSASSGLTGVLTLLHFSDHEIEGLLNILVVSCARFGPRALQLLGERLAVLGLYLTLFGSKIGLVANDDEWNPFRTEVIEDLVPYDPRHLKALLAVDRIDDYIAVYANEVLGVQDAVFILSRSIDYLRREVLTLVSYDFAESILDSGIVALYKVAIDELDCQTRFSNRSAANDGDLPLLWAGHRAGRARVSSGSGAARQFGGLKW